MLKDYLKSAAGCQGQATERLIHLCQAHTDAKAGLLHLVDLLEKGLIDADDPDMRGRLACLKLKWDDLRGWIVDLQKQMSPARDEVGKVRASSNT
ncbi:MAG: hypothetical protein BGP04_24640 [Rhizobiales bacterium 62-17]|nr:hypothetical protein [Hyphomicrobiales bacterium]OJY00708.1 MAG: hypothetical protein BGP04_24640 [Rhizobiales bacterium 62-17]